MAKVVQHAHPPWCAPLGSLDRNSTTVHLAYVTFRCSATAIKGCACKIHSVMLPAYNNQRSLNLSRSFALCEHVERLLSQHAKETCACMYAHDLPSYVNGLVVACGILIYRLLHMQCCCIPAANAHGPILYRVHAKDCPHSHQSPNPPCTFAWCAFMKYAGPPVANALNSLAVLSKHAINKPRPFGFTTASNMQSNPRFELGRLVSVEIVKNAAPRTSSR